MTQRKASPESMARLCEAFIEWDGCFEGGERRRLIWLEKVAPALSAYRAETTPPLRSRAEVDAEIAGVIRDWGGGSMGPFGADRFHKLQCLIAEPTAPESAPSVESMPEAERERLFGPGPSGQPEPNHLTDHDQDTREERPCGCEESDALKLRIERLVDAQKESRRLLRFALDLAQQIVQALETTPDA